MENQPPEVKPSKPKVYLHHYIIVNGELECVDCHLPMTAVTQTTKCTFDYFGDRNDNT